MSELALESHRKLSDEVFVEQFSNCTLNPKLFSHEAHLRLAWIHITNLGLKNAEKLIQNQLQNFVSHVGAKDKYNITVTLVAMKIMHHFMQHSKADNFKDFILENSHLKTDFKALIERHYSIDIFKSAKAKHTFLEPDLLPFT